MPRECKLCKFFSQSYNSIKKTAFEREVMRQTSTRQLVIFLRAYDLEVSRELVRRHILHCMGIQRKESLVGRVKEVIKNVQPKLPDYHVYIKCESCGRPIKWSDNGQVFLVLCEKRMLDGRVYEICPSCGRPTSTYGYDPEQLENPRNTEKLYGSLRR